MLCGGKPAGSGQRRYRTRTMQLRDIMTSAVVTAGLEDDILQSPA